MAGETFVIVVHYGGEWIMNNGIYSYVNKKGSKLMKIRADLDFLGLSNRIFNRLGIDRTRSDFKLSTMSLGVLSDRSVVFIVDDEDVEAFMDNVRSNVGGNLALYLTEIQHTDNVGNTAFGSATGSNQCSDTMAATSAQFYIDPMVQYQNTPIPQGPIEYVPDETFRVHCPNAHEHVPPSKTICFVGLEDVGDGNNFAGDASSEEDVSAHYEDEYEDTPACEGLYAEDMGYNTEDDNYPVDEDQIPQSDPPQFPSTIPMMHRPLQEVTPSVPDAFHWLPEQLPDPAPSSSEGSSSRGLTHLRVNQIFQDKATLQIAMGRHAIEQGYQFKVTRSTTERWETQCIAPGCKWRTRSTKIKGSELFEIRRIDDKHTCTRDQINPCHRQAGQRVLGDILKESFVRVDRIYRGKEIQTDISQRYRIDVSYQQAWRAKNWALNELQGHPEQSFMLLPLYCYNLTRQNPGTVTHIETDANNRFKYFYMSMGCSIRAFREHIRPVICVDAAHLKGKYLGMMFIAVCVDGNNQIYPLAFGVGASESSEAWTWFMSKLRVCVGNVANLAIISDRASSIDRAVRLVFPDAHHGSCCHHLRMNVRAKYGKQHNTESLYWKAAKAYRVTEFMEHMRHLETMNPRAAAYLTTAGYHKWARSHFPGRRYNIMTTNIAESFNALTRYARKLPITMLIEYIRATMQSWFYERRKVAVNWEHPLTPWATAKLARHVDKMMTWTVHPVTSYIFQVKDGQRDGVVDLEHRTCTCGKFQLSQLPCSHVAAVAKYFNLSDCNDWAHSYYSTETLRQVYQEPIFPVGVQSEWLQPPGEQMVVIPPIMQPRQAGRPRGVSRIPSRGEEPHEPLCSRCKTRGHTRLNCSSKWPADRDPGSSSTSGGQARGSSRPPRGPSHA